MQRTAGHIAKKKKKREKEKEKEKEEARTNVSVLSALSEQPIELKAA
jgi:hypothetical protein